MVLLYVLAYVAPDCVSRARSQNCVCIRCKRLIDECRTFTQLELTSAFKATRFWTYVMAERYPVRYGSKEINETRTGAQKINFLIRDDMTAGRWNPVDSWS